MTTSASGLTPTDLRPIVKIDAERIVAAINKGVSGNSVVVRPGNPGGSQGNVYVTFAEALAALDVFDGPRGMQFDDRFVSPIRVPANPAGGMWNTDDVEFYGDFDFVSGQNVQVFFEDGAQISAMSRLAFGVDFHSASTTVPVYAIEDRESFSVIENGAGVFSDPGATVPFIVAPAALTHQVVILLHNGGTLGQTGDHVMAVEAGVTVLLVLSTFATLPTDVLTGPGTVIAAIDSGSVQSNTPFPITQPAVGTLFVLDFTGAPFVQLVGLDPANWAGAPPTNVQQAIDRMASLLKTLNAGAPIP